MGQSRRSDIKNENPLEERHETLAMMLLPSSNVDIGPLAKGRLGADEPNITAIRDDSISALLNLQHANEPPESLVSQPYWFRCPEYGANG